MSKKYLSIKIEPARVIGMLLEAMFKGEDFKFSASLNTSQHPSAPKYTTNIGVSIWEKESQF